VAGKEKTFEKKYLSNGNTIKILQQRFSVPEINYRWFKINNVFNYFSISVKSSKTFNGTSKDK
jgi:hypothetical protein